MTEGTRRLAPEGHKSLLPPYIGVILTFLVWQPTV
jgi:hypothetical protein